MTWSSWVNLFVSAGQTCPIRPRRRKLFWQRSWQSSEPKGSRASRQLPRYKCEEGHVSMFTIWHHLLFLNLQLKIDEFESNVNEIKDPFPPADFPGKFPPTCSVLGLWASAQMGSAGCLYGHQVMMRRRTLPFQKVPDPAQWLICSWKRKPSRCRRPALSSSLDLRTSEKLLLLRVRLFKIK